MAGDWIKMTVHLDTDPSVILMGASLGLDELAVVGRLWKVWSWADQHSVDGNAVRVTCAFLDRITTCPGFANAMRDAGWLEGRDSALTFPRFDRHNGHPAKNRALGKNRVEKLRNATTVTEALPEKRREEKSITAPQPPAKLPETVAEAIAWTAGAGVPDSFVKEVFLEHEGTAWTYAGKPVTNFKSYVTSRWMRVKDVQAQREKYMTAPKKPYHKPPAISRPVVVPAWMAPVEEIGRLLVDPGANATRLCELGEALPHEGWSFIRGEQYNKLRKVMKEKK